MVWILPKADWHNDVGAGSLFGEWCQEARVGVVSLHKEGKYVLMSRWPLWGTQALSCCGSSERVTLWNTPENHSPEGWGSCWRIYPPAPVTHLQSHSKGLSSLVLPAFSDYGPHFLGWGNNSEGCGKPLAWKGTGCRWPTFWLALGNVSKALAASTAITMKAFITMKLFLRNSYR